MNRSGYMENIHPWKASTSFNEGVLVSHKNKVYRTRMKVPSFERTPFYATHYYTLLYKINQKDPQPMTKNTRITISVLGDQGRIGKEICRLVKKGNGCTLHAAIGRNRTGSLLPIFQASDVVIDFTNPSASAYHATLAAATNTPLLIGTTGMTHQDLQDISICNNSPTPILMIANVAEGMRHTYRPIVALAESLGKDWHCTIQEIHHPHKLDTPSGTSLQIKNYITEAMKTISPLASKYEIEICSKSIEDSKGEHIITFTNRGETISITHKVDDPVVYARGAVDLAKQLVLNPGRLDNLG